MGVNIPAENGGCGRTGGHTRPVIKGAPVKVSSSTASPCEAYLSGDRKPKILKYQIDAKTGQTVRQERVADGDPMWSSTPDTIPLTPDEDRTNTTRTERGRMQIEMIQALAAMRASRHPGPRRGHVAARAGDPRGRPARHRGLRERPRQRRRASNSAASAACPWPPAVPSPPPTSLPPWTWAGCTRRRWKMCRDAGLPTRAARTAHPAAGGSVSRPVSALDAEGERMPGSRRRRRASPLPGASIRDSHGPDPRGRKPGQSTRAGAVHGRQRSSRRRAVRAARGM